MYADPKFIKKNSYKVSLSDPDQAFLEMAAQLAGEQPSAYIRELAMEQLRQIFALHEQQQTEHNRRADV